MFEAQEGANFRIVEDFRIDRIDLVATEEWDERVHPDDRGEYYGNINLHFDNKIPFYETCHRVLCNGRYKWILDRGKVIERDARGKPLRIVGTYRYF